MDDEEQIAAVPPQNNKKMMGLIIGLLLVLIAVVVAASIYIIGFLGNGGAAGGNSGNIQDIILTTANIDDITFVPISHPINTNLLPDSNGRDAVVTLFFSIGINNTSENSGEMIRIISSAEPVIRNIGLSVIRDMTAFEVNSREGHLIISNEILRRLQQEFGTNLITNVYIMDLMTMN
ncbi:MAG: flagellar basal body-associated FliL family protein [Defluviitaleaceae bacterium]|nr:flagellar basal body-associated FliL family protein [Defluviitaleaceae bacterium]